MVKTYTVTRTHHRTDRKSSISGTIDELVKAYSYTLEKGASWQHEKGNKKINRNPKSITSLITNLNNAIDNASSNGYGGESYTAETHKLVAA